MLSPYNMVAASVLAFSAEAHRNEVIVLDVSNLLDDNRKEVKIDPWSSSKMMQVVAVWPGVFPTKSRGDTGSDEDCVL